MAAVTASAVAVAVSVKVDVMADAVDAVHALALAHGGSCEGPPGLRENAVGSLYLSYVRDPDGNKLCALHRPG
mgnify:CR=1 FL=1